jgi:hypothetical protein
MRIQFRKERYAIQIDSPISPWPFKDEQPDLREIGKCIFNDDGTIKCFSSYCLIVAYLKKTGSPYWNYKVSKYFPHYGER